MTPHSERPKDSPRVVDEMEAFLGVRFGGVVRNAEDFGLGIRLDSTLANKMREYDFYLSYNNSSKKDVTTVDETKFGPNTIRVFRRVGLVCKDRFGK